MMDNEKQERKPIGEDTEDEGDDKLLDKMTKAGRKGLDERRPNTYDKSRLLIRAEDIFSVLSKLSDGVVAADSKSRITYWDRNAERLLGYTRHQMLGQHIRTLLPKRVQHAHDGWVHDFATGQKILADMGAKDRPVVAMHADGREVYLDATLIQLTRDGEAHGFAILRVNTPEVPRMMADPEHRQLKVERPEKHENGNGNGDKKRWRDAHWVTQIVETAGKNKAATAILAVVVLPLGALYLAPEIVKEVVISEDAPPVKALDPAARSVPTGRSGCGDLVTYYATDGEVHCVTPELATKMRELETRLPTIPSPTARAMSDVKPPTAAEIARRQELEEMHGQIEALQELYKSQLENKE